MLAGCGETATNTAQFCMHALLLFLEVLLFYFGVIVSKEFDLCGKRYAKCQQTLTLRSDHGSVTLEGFSSPV